MRTILLFIICNFIFVCLAQKQQPIEPAILEVYYTLQMVKDTLAREKKLEDMMVLRIGKNSSQFFNHNRFYGDSLATDPEGKKLWGKLMIQAIRQRNFDAMPGSRTMGNYIYKNYPDGKITTTDQLLTDFFQYEEDFQPQAWQITDSVKQILDFACQKAVCGFRGRHWTVWFTPDIPISNGPWKFSGLPGLILEAYDTFKDYYYMVNGIKQTTLVPVTFYNFDEKKFIRTDRISFLKADRKLRDSDNPNRDLEAATGIDLSGGKASAPREKKTNYEFIERDYR